MTDCTMTQHERCGDCDTCERRRNRILGAALYLAILVGGASIGYNAMAAYRILFDAPKRPTVTCPAGKTPVVNAVDGSWLVRCEVKP